MYKYVFGSYYEICEEYGFVIPTNKNIKYITIPYKNKLLHLKHKDYVICEIIKEEKNENILGKIIEIVLPENIHIYKINEVINSYDIPQTFDANIEIELNNIPNEVTDKEIQISNRIDLRNRRIITIDGDNTKDFDDAISIEKLPNGNYLLGIHIADVCEYVKEGSYIDKEALKRGTSIYLPDRVIPMLPEKLSNGICSLNPKVNRFTITCDMEVDQNGIVVNSNIYESVIKTYDRMTYKNVEKIINKDKELCDKYSELIEDISLYNELKEILQLKRKQFGYINFNNKETYVLLDEYNIPISINLKERNEANNIIEEFMILCNETISHFFTTKEIPFLYRIHEKPSLDKIEDFNRYINYDIPFDFSNKSLQELLDRYRYTNEYYKIDYLLKKCLSKAKYSNNHSSHFGLGSKYYSHFTSPIRRYADLQIHRIIKEYLKEELSNERINHYNKLLPTVSNLINKSEIVSFKCETYIDKYMKCLYLSNKVNKNYKGVISSITKKGLYVELDNGCEGFISINYLSSKFDNLFFDKSNLSMYNKEIKYCIGDNVNVFICEVDLEKNKVYMNFV